MNFKEFVDNLNLDYSNLPKTMRDIDEILDSTRDMVSALFSSSAIELYQLSIERCILEELKELCEDSIFRDYCIDTDMVYTAFDGVAHQNYDVYEQADIEALFVYVRDWKGAYTVHNLIDKINRIDERMKREGGDNNL